MTSAYKLRVKIGHAELEAEGPVEEVKAAYEDWKELLESKLGDVKDGSEELDKERKPLAPAGEPDSSLTKRVFTERDGVISLLGLPRGEGGTADALVLLVYGYRLLKPDEYPVTGVRLMQAAVQSGLQLDRADRALRTREDLLVTSGFRRSKRYSLNNRGEQHAGELMRQLFE